MATTAGGGRLARSTKRGEGKDEYRNDTDRKRLEAAVLTIAYDQTGVVLAEVTDEDETMVTITYYYPIAAMKMFIGHELDRKIELLKKKEP